MRLGGAGGMAGAGQAPQRASSAAPTTADASGIRRDNLMPSPAAFQFRSRVEPRLLRLAGTRAGPKCQWGKAPWEGEQILAGGDPLG